MKFLTSVGEVYW